MAKLTKRQLQAALDALAAANNRARAARDKIMAHSEAVYGVTPGDVDNDEFIDSVDGGSGACHGMTVEEFDRTMRDGMRLRGIAMPGEEEEESNG